MRTYAILCKSKEMKIAEHLWYLKKVIDISPGNEHAWIALADMSKQGLVNRLHHGSRMNKLIRRFFSTFRNFPDFTWTILDGLVACQDKGNRRKNYYRLIELYEEAGRVDLACTARLQLTEYLVQEASYKEAINGLAETIFKSPGEGRFVPEMLNELEKTAKLASVSPQKLLEFYDHFLPTVPRSRGDRTSLHFISMYERGMELAKEAGDVQRVKRWQSELTAVSNKSSAGK